MLHAGTPHQAGLDPGWLPVLESLIAEGVRDGVFPGAVGLIVRGGVVGWRYAHGHAQVTPVQRPVSVDTIYDLASLTKVIAALPVALALAERGMLDIDAPVHSILPEFSGGTRGLVTFRHLLAHTSGLPSWRALYLRAPTRELVLNEICRTPLVADSGKLIALQMVPMQIRNLRLRTPSRADAAWLKQRLACASAPFGTQIDLDHDGVLTLGRDARTNHATPSHWPI